jgi:hypothetical protein
MVIDMGNIKGQLNKLKEDFKSYNDKLPIVTLDNGDQIRLKSGDWIKVLTSLGSDNEHLVIKTFIEHDIVKYTGQGNMPELKKVWLIAYIKGAIERLVLS